MHARLILTSFPLSSPIASVSITWYPSTPRNKRVTANYCIFVCASATDRQIIELSYRERIRVVGGTVFSDDMGSTRTDDWCSGWSCIRKERVCPGWSSRRTSSICGTEIGWTLFAATKFGPHERSLWAAKQSRTSTMGWSEQRFRWLFKRWTGSRLS